MDRVNLTWNQFDAIKDGKADDPAATCRLNPSLPRRADD